MRWPVAKYPPAAKGVKSGSIGASSCLLLRGVGLAFAIDEAAMWRTALDVSIDGIDVRTLSDEYTLVSLVLAAFEDLGQGLEKLKQLLDLYLLLRAMDGTTDWEAFFARRAPENLVAVTANVLALCADLFEARDELARLCGALEQRRGLCALAGRDEVLRLVAAPPKHRVLSAALSDFTRARRVSLVASFSEREGANQCEAIHEAFRSVTLG